MKFRAIKNIAIMKYACLINLKNNMPIPVGRYINTTKYDKYIVVNYDLNHIYIRKGK